LSVSPIEFWVATQRPGTLLTVYCLRHCEVD
jgi:hypothetical protein